MGENNCRICYGLSCHLLFYQCNCRTPALGGHSVCTLSWQLIQLDYDCREKSSIKLIHVPEYLFIYLRRSPPSLWCFHITIGSGKKANGSPSIVMVMYGVSYIPCFIIPLSENRRNDYWYTEQQSNYVGLETWYVIQLLSKTWPINSSLSAIRMVPTSGQGGFTVGKK